MISGRLFPLGILHFFSDFVKSILRFDRLPRVYCAKKAQIGRKKVVSRTGKRPFSLL